jgi:hypothetical protein
MTYYKWQHGKVGYALIKAHNRQTDRQVRKPTYSPSKRGRFIHFSYFYYYYYYYYYYYLFTAIKFAPGGSSPTVVHTKTIKQHYTVVQHNTIKRKQHNTIKRKHKIIRT